MQDEACMEMASVVYDLLTAVLEAELGQGVGDNNLDDNRTLVAVFRNLVVAPLGSSKVANNLAEEGASH